MKTVYIRNIFKDLWKERGKAAVFTVLCVAASVFMALRPGTPANLTDEQKEELKEYNSQIAEYDKAIRDLEAGIRDNEKQAEELKAYIDNSIYMRIDPDNIRTSAVQYGLQTGGSAGNILNSFITYINDGGMREEVEEEDKDLHPEYWRDIISCYINSNILNITVIHYDEEQCSRVMEIVKRRISEHVPEVKAVQGDFTLTEIESTEFVKADAGVVNTQNGNRNNLKNYETGLADLRSRLVNYRTSKANYIKNNEPDFIGKTEEDPKVRIIKYLLFGVIAGIVISIAIVTLRYILSDRLRSAEDLKDFGLNVIGICKEKGGLKFIPLPERAAMDVKVLAEVRGNSSVFFDLPYEDEYCVKAAEAYEEALLKEGINPVRGFHVTESAGELKQMIEAGSCLIFAEAGKTTYQDLKRHMEICERFKVTALGCVVIE